MDARRCRAHSKRGEKKHCGDWAAQGAEVCRRHGAGAPQVRAAERRRRSEAERAAATYGLPVTVAPIDALLGELHRTAGHVAWLGQVVADLEQVMDSTMFGLAPSAWIKLYQDERSHLTRVARDCVSAGVEERLVRVEEAKAELIAQAFRGFAVELGHDPADPAVRSAFRRHLALVRGDAT
jgi:hypothetical protein